MRNPILTVNFDTPLPTDRKREIYTFLKHTCAAQNIDLVVIEEGVTAKLDYDLSSVVDAIEEQTITINKILDILQTEKNNERPTNSNS